MESFALYNQYILEELPCVLCIHVRIAVFSFTGIAIAGLLFNQNRGLNRTLHAINVIIMLVFVERSWQTLAVERGWTFGDCSMDSGLPQWLALDQWIPALFKVHTTCGYTPLIMFNISMAEILMLASSGLAILSLGLFIGSCSSDRKY